MYRRIISCADSWAGNDNHCSEPKSSSILSVWRPSALSVWASNIADGVDASTQGRKLGFKLFPEMLFEECKFEKSAA